MKSISELDKKTYNYFNIEKKKNQQLLAFLALSKLLKNERKDKVMKNGTNYKKESIMKYDIKRFNPGQEFLNYYAKFETTEEAWKNCHRGDWMLWLASKLNVDSKLIVKAAALSALTVKNLMKDKRSIKVCESALSYANFNDQGIANSAFDYDDLQKDRWAARDAVLDAAIGFLSAASAYSVTYGTPLACFQEAAYISSLTAAAAAQIAGGGKDEDFHADETVSHSTISVITNGVVKVAEAVFEGADEAELDNVEALNLRYNLKKAAAICRRVLTIAVMERINEKIETSTN